MTLNRWTEVKLAWQEACQSYAQEWPEPQTLEGHLKDGPREREFGTALGLRIALALALTEAECTFQLYRECHFDTAREINHWRRVFGELTGEGA